jgi:hypothetical protein
VDFTGSELLEFPEQAQQAQRVESKAVARSETIFVGVLIWQEAAF